MDKDKKLEVRSWKFQMRKKIFFGFTITILILAIGLIATRKFFIPRLATRDSRLATRYQCSMHPQIVSDKPGNCPICQMRLQPVEETAAVSAAPLEGEEGHGSHGQERNIHGEEKTEILSGRASFHLAPERQQLIGVKTARIERRELKFEIRAAGKVAYDPELYTALNEYQEAVISREKIKDSPIQEAKERAKALVQASELKLRLMGIDKDQIQGMLAVDTLQQGQLNLLLPEKSVWIYAQVYEYELDLLKAGQTVFVESPSLPGRKFSGKIMGIDPVLNAQTRTARVRALISVSDGILRPETFVHLRVVISLGRRLGLPESALLDTGESRLVFIKKDQGYFEPRAVVVGRQAQGYWEILEGLKEGEEVVTSANFLIDSESRFKAAIEAFGQQKSHVH